MAKLNEGRLLGEYKLIRYLGSDGLSQRYLAEKQTSFGGFSKQFSLELIDPRYSSNEDFLEHFRIWMGIERHPNVHTIIDAQKLEDVVFTVAEYIESQTLRTLLESDGKLSVGLTVSFVLEILHGLEFLHDQKIIHRDLKPDNIYIHRGKPVLSGLHLVSFRAGEQFKGTHYYSAPEVWKGNVSVQSDIWAIGVILYELLCGSRPFGHEDLAVAIAEGFFPDKPATLPLYVPKPLKEIVDICLENDLDVRFQTVSDLRERLESFTLEERNSDQKDNVLLASFHFPEELKIPCEQYLLYFAQFLHDLGISATSNLKEEAGKVLFSITPSDDIQALDTIREALEIYLRLPSNPISSTSQEISVQKLESQVEYFRSQIRLARAELQLKEATIQQQQIALEVLRDDVMRESRVGSLPDKKTRNENKFLGGSVELGKIKKAGDFGVEIDLGELLSYLKAKFAKKG